jgi:hypothetical protein
MPGSATIFLYAQALVGRLTINCPESGDTVMTDMRDIGPTYYFRATAGVRESPNASDDPLRMQRCPSALCSTTSLGSTALRAVIPTASPVFHTTDCCTAGNIPVYSPLRNVRYEPHPHRLYRGSRDRT